MIHLEESTDRAAFICQIANNFANPKDTLNCTKTRLDSCSKA